MDEEQELAELTARIEKAVPGALRTWREGEKWHALIGPEEHGGGAIEASGDTELQAVRNLWAELELVIQGRAPGS
jgi:hypothetical protein